MAPYGAILNGAIFILSNGAYARDGSSEEFLGGYAVARDKILVTRPAITTFLSEFRGKTGLNLLKRPAAGDFFLKITYFQAIFKHFWCFLGGVITPPG